jgi:hypothetical protein
VATTWYNFHIMLDERRLWTAVLAQAIHDLIGIDTGSQDCKRSRLRRITRLWFESENTEAGSFRWICDQLEIDASWLRHRLLATVDQRAIVPTDPVRTSTGQAANPFSFARTEDSSLSAS